MCEAVCLLSSTPVHRHRRSMPGLAIWFLFLCEDRSNSIMRELGVWSSRSAIDSMVLRHQLAVITMLHHSARRSVLHVIDEHALAPASGTAGLSNVIIYRRGSKASFDTM